ncbi:MAG: FHA domain-containing protein [bacterium]|nr:FHA domain-containing protein [bacterium]
MLRWLRSIERKIEARLESTGGREWHALEAARAAGAMLLDNCECPHSGLTLAPNQFYFPFQDLRKIPANFERDVENLLAEEIKQHGYRLLGPVKVCAVGPEAELSDIALEWTDRHGRVAWGYIEGVEGPADGGLWGIAKKGVLLGRGSDADVRLPDPEVSRRHLGVKIVGDGRVRIEDLGSHNGTRLGKKIITQPVVIKAGKRVALGNSVVRIWTLPWIEE